MTVIPKPETDFLLQRAEQEAILAIRTEHPNAAAAHYDLALLYGERARMALTEGFDPYLRQAEGGARRASGRSPGA